MDEKKTNYLKELKNNTSILLSVVLGIVFGLILTMVDKFNMVSKFIARFVKDVRFFDGVMTGLYAIVLSVIAVLFLIFIINSFKKNVTKHDFVLLVYDFGILSYFILSCAVLKTTGARFVIILVLTIIAILLTVIRFFTVKETNEEKVNNVPMYRYMVFRNRYFIFIALLAVAIGIGLGFLINYVDFDAGLGAILPFWNNLQKVQKIGVVGAVIATFTIGFNLFSIVEGKSEKVSGIDLFLVFGTICSFFCGSVCFAFAKSATTIGVHAWMIVTFAFAFTLIVRSLMVGTTNKFNDELTRLQKYLATTFKRFLVLLMVVIALLITRGFVYLDSIGLVSFFDSTKNIVISFAVLIASLAVVSVSICSIILKGLKSKQVIALDYTLFLSLFIGFAMMYDLILAFSIAKLCIWLVAMIVVCFFICLRVKFNEIPLEEDKDVIVEESQPVEEEIETVEEETVDDNVEEVEEPEEVEEVEETVEEVDDDTDDENTEVVEIPLEEKDRLVIKTSKFTTKLKLCSDNTKEYYSTIKNALLSYGTHDRLSRKCESFRRKGLIAKITISGRTLRLHLALDPKNEEKFPINKYHQIDLGEKRQFTEVPFTLRVKSNRALKRALELIDLLFAERGINKKRRYVESDFAKDLVVDGEAIFDKLGHPEQLSTTYSVDAYEAFNRDYNEAFEKMMNLLPVEEKESKQITEIQNIYIDTVLDKINGDVISLQTLKDANIITKSSNNICIKIHTKLEKKIVVYCDEISNDALYAVLSLGGIVYLTK